MQLEHGLDDQLVNERAIEIAKRRLGYDRSTPDSRARTMIPAAEGGGVSGYETQKVVDEGLRKLIERQNQLLERQNALMERDAAGGAAPPGRPANRPLVIPAPAPGGGRRQ